MAHNKFAITTAEAEEIRKQKIIQKNAKKKAKYQMEEDEDDPQIEIKAMRAAALHAIEKSHRLEEEEEDKHLSPASKTKRTQNSTSQQFKTKKDIKDYYNNKQPIPPTELKRAFDMFDRDGNGSIDINELQDVLKNIGHHVKQEKLDVIMKEIDKDGNGTIDFEEFEYVVQVKMEDTIHDEDSMVELFEFFAQGETYITESDLLRMTKALKCKFTKDDIHDMMLLADRNRDGTITLDEFLHLCKLRVPV